jgi:hypothetical protein
MQPDSLLHRLKSVVSVGGKVSGLRRIRNIISFFLLHLVIVPGSPAVADAPIAPTHVVLIVWDGGEPAQACPVRGELAVPAEFAQEGALFTVKARRSEIFIGYTSVQEPGYEMRRDKK